jgi:hypothetical protein
VQAKKIRKAASVALFFLVTTYIFPQNDIGQRGSIPEELLRPRRDEAPRYPIDTVIGALGQGQASKEAYEIAQKTAAALLAGNMATPVLSSVNKVFLEDCMTRLKDINPQSFRLGSGREEPDGSFSFLVRFTGREQGITGELFVRLEERRPKPEPPPLVKEAKPEPADSEFAEIESEDENNAAVPAAVAVAEPIPAPPENVPVQKVWIFEDLILEEPRSREVENRENRHRFDFSPYERFY